MATHDKAQLLKLSGPRDRRQPTGAYDLVAAAAKNLVMIMKDGKVYRNTVK
ncbi:MAG TPA: hypothetical protein VFG76_09955 [Candidatus Polarisedimenticolia bacterium]|nr:hypothetical protein [Candidatus Polarisedimenticolia bacterium]